ncbi:MAG: hypothetical protein K6E40_15215 [Desulfovibrio sp.]|nr:hypothetical protein [Desulfovibrio sp.]
MKKTGIVLAIVFALLLAGLAAGGFVLKKNIEQSAREILKTAIGPDAETAVGDVSFSFLDRTVTAKDWRSRRDLPGAPISMQASEVKAVFAPRVALASIPSLGSLLFKDADVVPVFDRVAFYGFKSASGPVTYEAEAVQAEGVRMTYDLIKKRLAGIEPSPLENVEGTWTEQFSVRRMRIVAEPEGTLSVREVKLTGINGVAAERFVMDSAEFATNDGTIVNCRQLSAEKLAFPASAYRKIQELGDGKDANLADLLGILAEFKKSGPFVSQVKLDGIRMPADAGYLDADELVFGWKSVDPLSVDMHLRGLKIPAKLLEKSDLKLRGLDGVEIDADLDSTGLATSRHKGFLRIRNIFELQFDGTYIAPSSAVKDVHLQLKDYALLAQAAVNFTPDGMAATMMLKAGAQALCLGDPDERKSQCAKLAQFIDAPGTIVIDTPKGLAIPTDKIVEDLTHGRFGSLFTLSVQPGGRPLDQLIRELPR